MTTTLVGNAILYSATVGAVLTVGLYSVVPWFASLIGRQAMAYSLAMALLLLVISSRNVFGVFSGYEQARLVAFGLVGLVIWTQNGVMLRIRWINRKEAKHGSDRND